MTAVPGARPEYRLIEAKELAVLLGRATKNINGDVVDRPETLPPTFRMPGRKKPVWRVIDVMEWMQALADVEKARRVAAFKDARDNGMPVPRMKAMPLNAQHIGKRATDALNEKHLKESE